MFKDLVSNACWSCPARSVTVRLGHFLKGPQVDLMVVFCGHVVQYGNLRKRLVLFPEIASNIPRLV
jgi:hypothetical protein